MWGVTKILKRSPGLEDFATDIANKALTHPAVAIGRRPAAAIGSQELLAVLEDLADTSNTSLDAKPKKALSKLLQSSVPRSSQVHARELAEQFEELFPSEKKKMQEAAMLLKRKASQLTNNFDMWFDTVMNRTTDRFVIHTRLWTIFFAAVIAFVLHVDTIQMIRLLSTDAEIRASLIGMAERGLERAEALLESVPPRSGRR